MNEVTFDDLEPEVRQEYNFWDIAKIYRDNKRMFIFTETEDDSQKMDIWVWEDGSWRCIKKDAAWFKKKEDHLAILEFVYHKKGGRKHTRRCILVSAYSHRNTLIPTIAVLELNELSSDQKTRLFENLGDIFDIYDENDIYDTGFTLCQDVFEEAYKCFDISFIEIKSVTQYKFPIVNNIF